jgi:hypothetical protein
VESPHSTFHRYLRKGRLPRDWAASCKAAGTFGERCARARRVGLGPPQEAKIPPIVRDFCWARSTPMPCRPLPGRRRSDRAVTAWAWVTCARWAEPAFQGRAWRPYCCGLCARPAHRAGSSRRINRQRHAKIWHNKARSLSGLCYLSKVMVVAGSRALSQALGRWRLAWLSARLRSVQARVESSLAPRVSWRRRWQMPFLGHKRIHGMCKVCVITGSNDTGTRRRPSWN